MTQQAQFSLDTTIMDAIEYHRAEWDITHAEAIGVLMIQVHRLLRESDKLEEGS